VAALIQAAAVVQRRTVEEAAGDARIGSLSGFCEARLSKRGGPLLLLEHIPMEKLRHNSPLDVVFYE
jgi:hypothetical protein